LKIQKIQNIDSIKGVNWKIISKANMTFLRDAQIFHIEKCIPTFLNTHVQFLHSDKTNCLIFTLRKTIFTIGKL